MNDLQLFKFENKRIRSLCIDGEPWFVGKDVAKTLGYSKPENALARHVDEDDKTVTKCDTSGGTQEMTIINESGLYSLILSSKLPSAKEFKHWITSEVLPQIRKTGKYAPKPLSREELLAKAVLETEGNLRRERGCQ